MRKITAEELEKLSILAERAHARACLLETRLKEALRTFEVRGKSFDLGEFYASKKAVKSTLTALQFMGYKMDKISAELLCDNWKVRNKRK